MLLAVAAVAFACASGLVIGIGGRRVPGAVAAVAAVAALVIAPSGGEQVRAAPRVLALKAPSPTATATPEPPRGPNDTGANPTGAGSAAPNATGSQGAAREMGEPESEEPESAAALVRSFYADLDARRYAAAWKRLSPAVQQSFVGFATWRDGYATTAGHALEDLRAEGATVTHTLVASCGETTGRYAVNWRFDGAKAVALTAEALSGTAC